ncbi:hypothetical protein AB0F92_22735 [Kitasatospora aureofaciens]|nr:hypothetical protein BOQ63_012440 [Streptomyces viridifaciens]
MNVTNFGVPASTANSVVMYPAVYVRTGSLTINSWISDGTFHYTTNTP